MITILGTAAALAGLYALSHLWRGTTLAAPVAWAALAVLLVAAVEAPRLHEWQEILRSIAMAGTVCPMAALLGAKRPQHHAWQLIVLSLWVVLALPALQQLALGQGPTELDGLRWAVIAALIALGVSNTLPTRFWAPGLLVASAQAVFVTVNYGAELALALLGAAGLWAALFGRATPSLPPGSCDAGLDRLWNDFRDAYGAIWALRVLERFNASAAAKGWNARLHWNGFQNSAPGAGGTAEPAAPARAFQALLRRFVSREWIAQRLERDANTASMCENRSKAE